MVDDLLSAAGRVNGARLDGIVMSPAPAGTGASLTPAARRGSLLDDDVANQVRGRRDERIVRDLWLLPADEMDWHRKRFS